MPQVKLLKQRGKDFIWQLNKAIDRGKSYFDANVIDDKEVDALKKNRSFSFQINSSNWANLLYGRYRWMLKVKKNIQRKFRENKNNLWNS